MLILASHYLFKTETSPNNLFLRREETLVWCFGSQSDWDSTSLNKNYNS